MSRYVFRLPDVGEGTAEAEIVVWHVKLGDRVAEDQPLVDVMTDKATVEITSPVEGRVVAVSGEPGDMAPVGSTLAEFEVAAATAADAPSVGLADASLMDGGGEDAGVDAPSPPAFTGEGDPAAQGGGSAPPPSPKTAAELSRAPAFFRPDNARVLTSPAIRRRAKEEGVSLEAVRGTGPGGRITLDDFEARAGAQPERTQAEAARPAAVKAAPLTSPLYAERDAVEEVRVIGMRRRIAEKMQLSKRRIPHFSYIEEVDVTELEDLRVHLNTTRQAARPKLTLLPFLIRALVKVLPRYPQINATYDDEAGVVSRCAAVHLGMATQTSNGLVVPVIRHAEARDLWELAAEITRLATATREGTAGREELSGSTLTLTSLGPLGGVAHTPVINHPEVAIIGPNRIIERPAVRNGQIVVRRMMNISASFDHRIVDGYDAAEFVQALKGLLEHPATVFID